MNTPSNATNSNPLRVRRGRVESVDLYEVKDSELDLLEKGAPSTIQLNFSVFLLSLAFSGILALCTANFKWEIVKTAFVFIVVVGILLGTYLLISWWRTRTSITAVVRRIRIRLETPPTEAQAPVSSSPESEAIAENEPTG